jgi:hypothetical protein
MAGQNTFRVSSSEPKSARSSGYLGGPADLSSIMNEQVGSP